MVGTEFKIERHSQLRCSYVWDSLYVNAAGEVYSCCLEKPWMLGSIYDESMQEVMQNHKRRTSQTQEVGGTLPCRPECIILPQRVCIEPRSSLKLRRLHVEWGFACNANCIFCYQRSLSQRTTLSMVTMKKWIEGVHVEEIMIMGGEPLVMEECMEFVDWLSAEQSPTVVLQTNGIRLSGRCLEWVLRRVSKVIISINAATPGTYEAVIRRAGFEKLLANIGILISRRNCFNGLGRPAVEAHMTVVPENCHEIVDFIQMARTLGCDSVSFCPDCVQDRALSLLHRQVNFLELREAADQMLNEKNLLDGASDKYLRKLFKLEGG